MNERERLIVLLERARRRADAAPPYSPEWDAATDEIEELERAISDSREEPEGLSVPA